MTVLRQLPRILIVGGYGAFGARAAERLARDDDLEIVIAGRSGQRASEAAAQLRRTAKATVSHVALDAVRPDPDVLRRLSPAVLINASGPYQAQDYTLARAALAAGAHYIDLADARTFVTGIVALDSEARAAGVLVTSGASSVPALAAAIIDQHAGDFARLDTIHHGITPGNGYDPGEATAASILGGVGKPFPMLIDATWQTVHGWQGLWRYDFPGLGRRLMAHCDVPDVELFPARYPGVRTVRFSAGLEVGVFQLSLWLLAGAVRAGVLHRPERLAGLLMAMKRRLRFLGSDSGGLFVVLSGVDRDGTPMQRAIHLIARLNQGPYVPVIASVVLARKLVHGNIAQRGAMPCMGLFTLDEFNAEVANLAITIVSSPISALPRRVS